MCYTLHLWEKKRFTRELYLSIRKTKRKKSQKLRADEEREGERERRVACSQRVRPQKNARKMRRVESSSITAGWREARARASFEIAARPHLFFSGRGSPEFFRGWFLRKTRKSMGVLYLENVISMSLFLFSFLIFV